MCIAVVVLLLKSMCAVAQGAPPLAHYCPEVAANGISLAEMAGSDTTRVRLDLVLQSIRLCPREFISAAKLFSPSDSLLSSIQGLMDGADPTATAIARDAAARIQTGEDPTSAPVAKQLQRLLGQPRPASSRSLAEVDRRDSEDLTKMAAGQQLRAGERQSILVLGIFIMWVANRTTLNAAFESAPSSQEWLRRFPPGIGMVGGGTISEELREFERSVIRRARANDGPIDKWYREFKIEQ